MKIKPAEKSGGVVVELGPKEAQLPPLQFGETTPTLPSFTLKKILVPVDFSKRTEKALQYAIPFALQFDAEVTLLHVVEVCYMPPTEMGGVTDMESVEDATLELEALGARLAGVVRYQTILRKGSTPHEIIDVAKALGSNLIILSTHGRTGLPRILMGSTAEQVVRHAGCPLLIVRENEQEFVAESGPGLAACAEGEEAKFETEMKASL